MSADAGDPEQQKRACEGLFSRAAATYGQVGPGYFDHFGSRLVEFARIPPGARVLDVACGRGAVLFPAVKAVSDLGEVTGVDLSAVMAAETSREIERRGIPNARVLVMDAEQLTFEDNSFDVVLCGFALFFFPELGRALEEFRRVLAPGGWFAASTWGTRDERWNWLETLVSAYLPPAPEETPGAEPGPDFSTPPGLTQILHNGGLGSLRSTTETAEFAYRSEAEWWQTNWSHGFRQPLEEIERRMGPEGLQRFQAEAYRHLRTFQTPDGIPQAMQVVFAAGRKE